MIFSRFLAKKKMRNTGAFMQKLYGGGEGDGYWGKSEEKILSCRGGGMETWENCIKIG